MAKHLPLRTYAEAYISSLSARADGLGEFKSISDQIRQHPEIRAFLSDVSIPEKDRKKAIEYLAPDAAEETRSFLFILGEDGLLQQTDRMEEQIRQAYERIADCKYVTVMSAVPLTKEEEKRLKQTLEKKGSKNIRLQTQIDSSILGGLIIQQNDSVTDISVKGRLQHLKRLLHV